MDYESIPELGGIEGTYLDDEVGFDDIGFDPASPDDEVGARRYRPATLATWDASNAVPTTGSVRSRPGDGWPPTAGRWPSSNRPSSPSSRRARATAEGEDQFRR